MRPSHLEVSGLAKACVIEGDDEEEACGIPQHRVARRCRSFTAGCSPSNLFYDLIGFFDCRREIAFQFRGSIE